MAATSFEMIAARELGDPDAGILLARLTPDVVFPNGDTIRMPTTDELIGFRREFTGAAFPGDDASAALLARYYQVFR